MNHTPIENQAVKIISAWTLIGITSWAELASALAALYSALLIAEWIWKRILKRVAIGRGWIAMPTMKEPEDA